MQAGVVKVSEITFAATPGYNYSLRFGSPVIDIDKVAVSSADTQNSTIRNFTRSDQIFINPKRNISNFSNMTAIDLEVKVDINLRECEIGE